MSNLDEANMQMANDLIYNEVRSIYFTTQNAFNMSMFGPLSGTVHLGTPSNESWKLAWKYNRGDNIFKLLSKIILRIGIVITMASLLGVMGHRLDFSMLLCVTIKSFFPERVASMDCNHPYFFIGSEWCYIDF